ncbi:glycosyltransferase family 2 protein [Nonomuraea polychroma]|uniref:glycosyltransferase family 2 protein n=1 Tax=Nonomuraea polychroma TaxID=46176 RepID=UPI003D89E8D4
MGDQRVGAVVITWNRREEALTSVGRLLALPERPHVVLVDNGSDDGTAQAVADAYPEVEVVALHENLGAVGTRKRPLRNVGVARLRTPTSPSPTTTPGGRPARSHPALRGFPGPHWAASWPGRRWCGGRRSWNAEGSTAGAGWAARRSCWPWTWRRPVGAALRRTMHLARTVPRDRVSALATLDALCGLPWVPAERRRVPPRVEARLAGLEDSQAGSRARRYVS